MREDYLIAAATGIAATILKTEYGRMTDEELVDYADKLVTLAAEKVFNRRLKFQQEQFNHTNELLAERLK